jgi:hypothetical protein
MLTADHLQFKRHTTNLVARAKCVLSYKPSLDIEIAVVIALL